MNNLLGISLFTFVILSSSCSNNDDKNNYDQSIMPAGSTTTAITTPSSPDSNLPAVFNGQPPVLNTQPSMPQANNIITPQVVTNQNTAIVPKVASASQGVNPAHGQPGHDCAIPVGAPLGSKPTANVQTQNITPTAIKPSPAAPAIVTAAGMNPPHGQPGHRCDISVGEPLNSKPSAVVPSTPATTTEVKEAPKPIIE